MLGSSGWKEAKYILVRVVNAPWIGANLNGACFQVTGSFGLGSESARKVCGGSPDRIP